MMNMIMPFLMPIMQLITANLPLFTVMMIYRKMFARVMSDR